MKPTLLILAAGMGSRYGGLKQLDGIGRVAKPLWIIPFSMPKEQVLQNCFVIRSNFKEIF